MSKNLIKYGISTDYISSWGYKEAVREIMQNFMDYGDYNIEVSDDFIECSNSYQPDSYEFLKVGFSKKHNDNSIGKYGEGLKMAMLVLNRLNLSMKITCSINGVSKSFLPDSYEDEFLGKCFAILVYNNDIVTADNFTIRFEKTDEYESIASNFIKVDCKPIFSTSMGDIVDMPAGNIYVGGIYVTNFSDMERSYNLMPHLINLGRDRDFPSTWDVEYHCSKIFEQYCKQEGELLSFSTREISHISNLPSSFFETVEPMIINDEIVLNSNTCGILSNNLKEITENDPTVKGKINKLRIRLIEKIKPYDALLQFKDCHNWELSAAGQSKLLALIEKSKEWK